MPSLFSCEPRRNLPAAPCGCQRGPDRWTRRCGRYSDDSVLAPRGQAATSVVAVTARQQSAAAAGRAGRRRRRPPSRRSRPASIPTARSRGVIVLTDIANEPDDQMSLVRLLVSPTSSTSKRSSPPRPRMRDSPAGRAARRSSTRTARCSRSSRRHEADFPRPRPGEARDVPGKTASAWPPSATGRMTPGAEAIVRAADTADARPLWVSVWGGANTLAQALLHVRATRPAATWNASSPGCACTRFRIRTMRGRGCGASSRRCTTSPRRATRTTTTSRPGRASAATSSIKAPGADFTTVSEEWVDEHMRNKGPLGKLYPQPCCIIEGDTPSFLGLINNGLRAP